MPENRQEKISALNNNRVRLNRKKTVSEPTMSRVHTSFIYFYEKI